MFNGENLTSTVQGAKRIHPTSFSHFQALSLTGIAPSGWLRDFLTRQVTGLTGNVALSGYPYGYRFWGSTEDDLKGSYGSWWPYEQTAYWIDGALKCGFLASDREVYGEALAEVEFAVEHAGSDGFIGPESLRSKDRVPHAVFFRGAPGRAHPLGGARR